MEGRTNKAKHKKQQTKQKKNAKEMVGDGKLKQLSGFISVRQTWVRLEVKCEKELLTN